jgi:hypothetical protein
MKIDQSGVQLDAQHACRSSSRIEIEREFTFRSALQVADAGLPGRPSAAVADARRPEAQEATEEAARRIRQLIDELVSSILALISGQNCRTGGKEGGAAGSLSTLFADGSARGPAARPLRTIEWRQTVTEHIEEHEATSFAACGTVRTADGREIAFDLQLAMSRDFSCTRSAQESGTIELRDPLVINFDGQAAELSGKTMRFDLDADGQAELVPELAAGCGYLCFDAGNDGKIADGRELFGATGEHRGKGFADLARHDADRNGWIDEADPAFAALGVWFPDGRIKPLKDTGVGALHVGSVDSPFALKDEDNRLRGQIVRSGLYLNEDGTAGTLQQVDLGIDETPVA